MFDRSSDTAPRYETETDEPLGIAIAAGVLAAVFGGIIWTLIIALTGYEVGYVAWAIGALVGFGMSRVTPRRDSVAAGIAAALALVGLILAKALIGLLVLPGQSADHIATDENLMWEASYVDLEQSRGFPPAIQAEYDALAPDDTLSDALWERMVDASTVHLNSLSETERLAIARQYSDIMYGDLGLVGTVTAQLSGYDLLWIVLAVSSAWGIMKHREEDEAPAEESASAEGGSVDFQG
jgi:hypothetical protein